MVRVCECVGVVLIIWRTCTLILIPTSSTTTVILSGIIDTGSITIVGIIDTSSTITTGGIIGSITIVGIIDTGYITTVSISDPVTTGSIGWSAAKGLGRSGTGFCVPGAFAYKTVIFAGGGVHLHPHLELLLLLEKARDLGQKVLPEGGKKVPLQLALAALETVRQGTPVTLRGTFHLSLKWNVQY